MSGCMLPLFCYHIHLVLHKLLMLWQLRQLIEWKNPSIQGSTACPNAILLHDFLHQFAHLFHFLSLTMTPCVCTPHPACLESIGYGCIRMFSQPFFHLVIHYLYIIYFMACSSGTGIVVRPVPHTHLKVLWPMKRNRLKTSLPSRVERRNNKKCFEKTRNHDQCLWQGGNRTLQSGEMK